MFVTYVTPELVGEAFGWSKEAARVVWFLLENNRMFREQQPLVQPSPVSDRIDQLRSSTATHRRVNPWLSPSEVMEAKQLLDSIRDHVALKEFERLGGPFALPEELVDRIGKPLGDPVWDPTLVDERIYKAYLKSQEMAIGGATFGLTVIEGTIRRGQISSDIFGTLCQLGDAAWILHRALLQRFVLQGERVQEQICKRLLELLSYKADKDNPPPLRRLLDSQTWHVNTSNADGNDMKLLDVLQQVYRRAALLQGAEAYSEDIPGGWGCIVGNDGGQYIMLFSRFDERRYRIPLLAAG